MSPMCMWSAVVVIGLWTTLGWCQPRLQEEARPQDSAVPLDLERDSTRSPYEQEIASYEQALAVARQEKNRRGEGVALNQLGVASQRMGQYERALALHEQALTIARAGAVSGHGRRSAQWPGGVLPSAGPV